MFPDIKNERAFYDGDWGAIIKGGDGNFEISVKITPTARDDEGGVVKEADKNKYQRGNRNKKLVDEAEQTFRSGFFGDMGVGEERQLTSSSTIRRIR